MTTLEVKLALRVGTLSIDLSLEVDPAGLMLLGPNGSGKTTVLLAILGLQRPRPESGRVVLGGDVLFDATTGRNLPPEQRGIAYVPQDYALFPHLTAAENVEFALSCLPHPPDRRSRFRRARELLDGLGIQHAADRAPGRLSGGERQKVALARALATDPRALLLDEPLAALDVEARDSTRELLAQHLGRLGRPFIVVTHDPSDAQAFGTPIAVLENGRILQRGSPSEIRQDPASPHVAKLFGKDSS
jgi:molybdate transport system ATP-binding protein